MAHESQTTGSEGLSRLSCLVLTIFLGQAFGIHMGWSGPSRNMCGTVGASRMTLQMEK